MSFKFITPRFEVLMKDGAQHTVQVMNPDLIKYEKTRKVRGWGTPQEDAATWGTFVTWSAMQREGLIDGIKFEDFAEDACRGLTPLDDGPGDVQDPTSAAPAPG